MAMETALQAARRHVRQSRRIVTRIERVVSKAKRDGHAFPEAEELLDSMRALLEAVNERVERHEYEVARTTTELRLRIPRFQTIMAALREGLLLEDGCTCSASAASFGP